MKANLFICLMTWSLASSGVHAQGATFSQRALIAAVEGTASALARAAQSPDFPKLSPEAKARELLAAGTRAQAFNLQSLTRLLENYPVPATQALLKKVRSKAKQLEDGLGEFDKYKGVGNSRKAEEAANKLAAILEREGWISIQGRSPLLAKLKTEIAKASWLETAEDRRFALSELSALLQKVDDTKYDMRRLEKRGLHELRRDLRWFPISAVALKGLIVASPKIACPQRQLIFSPHADPKYAIPTRSTVPSPCAISACLDSELNGAVGLFGKLKDEAEEIVLKDPDLQEKDITPPQIAAHALKSYSELVRSSVIESTRTQIQACLR